MSKEDKELNIVKKTCKELGLTYTQLGELMGVNDGTPAQWSSKGNIPEMAKKFMELLVENKKLKAKFDIIKTAHKILLED